MSKIPTETLWGGTCVGQPTMVVPDRRVGSNGWGENHRTRGGKESGEETSPSGRREGKNRYTPAETYSQGKMWDILSRPGYACEDDGLGDLVAEETLYYAIHEKEFAGDAYRSQNFRQETVLARDIRRARVESIEIPAGQTTLGEYQMA